MSHIVQIQTEVRDEAALAAACRRLGLAEPVHGPAELFSGTVTGWQVRLSGWVYPVVADLATGRLDYDDYEGRWGDRKELGRLLQAYAVERATAEARKAGHRVGEESLADGSIRLTVRVGGAA